MRVEFSVNGAVVSVEVSPRLLLVDVLRQDLGLTGTHVGCEQGVCGACTVAMDGETIRSCLLFAVQANGREIETVEGLAASPKEFHALQQAFWDTHALQCGFCTPGFLMTIRGLLAKNPDPDEGEIRRALAGILCRCTGYVNIVEAVKTAAVALRASDD